MNALALLTSRDGAPPARAALLDLNAKIERAERQLDTLIGGRDRLRSELGRADTAKIELETLITEDASSLVGKLRSGVSWALSSLGSPRAMTLVAQLSESRVQHDIGAKALAEIEADIAVSEREISDMKGRKNDAIIAVMREASAGFVADLAILADDLRQLLVTLAALDRLTARSNGDWSPTERVVVTLPSVGGVPEQVVIAPNSSIEKAKATWLDFAAELEKRPLANVEKIKFPHVLGNEDDGRTVYADLSRVERQLIDLERALGV
jgi:hypothetical protein